MVQNTRVYNHDGISGTELELRDGFCAVAAGEYHSIALKPDGSLVSWGFDFYEQVADTPTMPDFGAALL